MMSDWVSRKARWHTGKSMVNDRQWPISRLAVVSEVHLDFQLPGSHLHLALPSLSLLLWLLGDLSFPGQKVHKLWVCVETQGIVAFGWPWSEPKCEKQVKPAAWAAISEQEPLAQWHLEERPEDWRVAEGYCDPGYSKGSLPASGAYDSRVNVKNWVERARNSANNLVSIARSKGMEGTLVLVCLFVWYSLSPPQSTSWNLCSVKNLEYLWALTLFWWLWVRRWQEDKAGGWARNAAGGTEVAPGVGCPWNRVLFVPVETLPFWVCSKPSSALLGQAAFQLQILAIMFSLQMPTTLTIFMSLLFTVVPTSSHLPARKSPLPWNHKENENEALGIWKSAIPLHPTYNWVGFNFCI